MQRNTVLGGVAIVAIAAAAYFTFSGYGRQKPLPTTVHTLGVCLANGKDVEITHELDEVAPWTCPECGEQAVYPWLYCFDCQRRFVPKLDRDSQGILRMPPYPACPACGSQSYSAFKPEDRRQELKRKDARLPKWQP